MTTSTERSRRHRARKKAEGWKEITVAVPRNKEAEVRAFIASLGTPPPKHNPAQMDLLDALKQRTY